jgi:hypothetical protein
MTEASGNELSPALEQRLEALDDASVQRIAAVMDVAGELHRQSSERLDRLTETVNQLAALVAQSIESANADRAIIRDNQTEIRRIWEYLLSQHPNGQGNREG